MKKRYGSRLRRRSRFIGHIISEHKLLHTTGTKRERRIPPQDWWSTLRKSLPGLMYEQQQKIPFDRDQCLGRIKTKKTGWVQTQNMLGAVVQHTHLIGARR